MRLTRVKAAWRDSARAYVVHIDGQRVGSIRRGKTVEFTVAPGVHGLQLSLDSCNSRLQSFRVGDETTAEFLCRPGGAFWQIWQVVDVNNYIALLPISGVNPA